MNEIYPTKTGVGSLASSPKKPKSRQNNKKNIDADHALIFSSDNEMNDDHGS